MSGQQMQVDTVDSKESNERVFDVSDVPKILEQFMRNAAAIKKWHTLYTIMGLNEANKETLRVQVLMGVIDNETLFETMIKEWLKNQGGKATIGSLCLLLREDNNNLTADHLMDAFQADNR